MRILSYVLIILAASMILGAVIARLQLAPAPFVLEAKALLGVANTTLLFVIALGILQLLKKKR